MSSTQTLNIRERLNQLEGEMKANLARLVKYNSVESAPLPGKPFGEIPAAVLEEALQIAQELGFRTKNLDNYCGYAEIGEGKDIIGIVAHLDIVPAGEGWNSDPFTMEEKDGVLYGRGVSDDKGAAIASLYTLKLIQESKIKLNKRIRVLLGCNEETGSHCMRYYNEVEEPITIGFTPDGEFPGIHGEKGILRMSAFSKNSSIISMKGGVVSNAVCDKFEIVIPKESVDKEKLEAALKETALVSFTVSEEGNTLKVFAQGKAAHASTPSLGINAAGLTMASLEKAGMKDSFLTFYNTHIGVANDGSGYGIKITDEYGCTTLCNGIARTENGVHECTIDIRYPVTCSSAQIKDLIKDHMEDENGYTKICMIEDPLFFPVDSPLVKSLYDAYVQVTGDTANKPEVIGGGTYAKSIPGIIAFGCEMTSADNHIHNVNERLLIDEFKLQVEIYIQAVKNLLAI